MDTNSPISALGNQTWICPKCNESMMAQEKFCSKCGHENVPSGGIVITEKSKSVKIILLAILLLALIGVAMVGAYLINDARQKKMAEAYLATQGKSFGDSIVLINALSSDKLMEDKDDNAELFAKKLDDEQNKTEKAAGAITTAKANSAKTQPNKLVSGMDSLLKQYYADAETTLDAYNNYIVYVAAMNKEEIALKNETDKLKAIFKNANSDADASKSLKALITTLNDSGERVKNITPPPGLEEAHKKEIAMMDSLTKAIKDMSDALDAKNSDKLVQAMDDLDTIVSDEKTPKEIKQLVDYFFSDLHNKYTDLRKEADNIKTELIKASTQYGADIRVAEIEGW